MLAGKRILIGITGGIAAYKIPELVRRLKDHGAEVRVVMTQGAKAFITPLTLQAVSGHPVGDSLLDPAAEAAMGHIEFGRWADLVVVAPASADFIARYTAGMADDLLATVCLATQSPVVLAPAMNQQMWQAIATQANIATLQQRGIALWGPAAGSQACGEIGPGRMLEPAQLLARIEQHFAAETLLDGVKLVITAGPTREAIDPVRYISNHSSGKMGFALAQAAQQMGAEVTLVSGPVHLATPAQVERIDVNSAQQMLDAVMATQNNCDVFIACAAVADYRMTQVAEQKIKKSNAAMTLQLERNPDIVATVAAQANKPFTVGFAAETENVADYARDKMQRKNLDMIAANDVSNANIGFNSDENALTVFSGADAHPIPQASKTEIARQLLCLIAEKYHQHAQN